jgi:putative transcriptional regulator
MPSRLTAALLETADDMRRVGALSPAAHAKITLRHLGPDAPLPVAPISDGEIKRISEASCLSQAAFARYLLLTVGYVSQLERGAKQATGPALSCSM